MTDNLGKGSLEVIVGPMFSGKTEEIINIAKKMDFANTHYKIFKPLIDTRYNPNEIVSHNKSHLPCIRISHGEEIKKHLDSNTQAIIIDEAQFFNETFYRDILKLIDEGYRIVISGLDMDFRGEPFKTVSYLLAIADKVTKLTAICSCCKKPAVMTQRIIDGKPAYYNDPLILIGEKDSYEPRCRNCHKVIYSNGKE